MIKFSLKCLNLFILYFFPLFYSRIFWSDIGQSVIRSAFMDGSDQVDSVLNVKSYGIAVDYQGKLVQKY